jgi:hypothetical protein
MLVAHIGGIPILLIGITYFILRCASRRNIIIK